MIASSAFTIANMVPYSAFKAGPIVTKGMQQTANITFAAMIVPAFVMIRPNVLSFPKKPPIELIIHLLKFSARCGNSLDKLFLENQVQDDHRYDCHDRSRHNLRIIVSKLPLQP